MTDTVDYFEIEITDKDGKRFYEISTSITESHQLCKLHNGVSFRTVK
jgi:hypothetical protein